MGCASGKPKALVQDLKPSTNRIQSCYNAIQKQVGTPAHSPKLKHYHKNTALTPNPVLIGYGFCGRALERRPVRLIWTFLALTFCHVAGAQSFDLRTDFPGGNLASYSVGDNTIRLVGQATWSEFPNDYRWVHFRGIGFEGEQPTFEIGSASNSFLGDLSGHRFVFSYDNLDWQFFDNNSLNGHRFTFGNETPFSQSEVFVAYSTPYPVSRTIAHTERASDHWFVAPTLSANQQLSVGSIGDLPLIGYSITNPLIETNKSRVVLIGGNHSGEMGGSFALEGMLNFLLSDDPRAQGMRDTTEFLVYPQVDPLGRSQGFYRGNSQNAANDHNRFWDALSTGDDGGFAELPQLARAMKLDSASSVDYAFDFHGFFDSSPNFVYSDSNGVRSEFVRSLTQRVPRMEIVEDNRLEPEGIFEFWAKTSQGLNADLSFTPEFSPNLPAADLVGLGEHFALAMYDQLGKPQREIMTSEIDALTTATNLVNPPIAFDLNKDGAVNDGDRRFFVHEVVETYFGDANLDGDFDTSDLVNVFQSNEYEDTIIGNSTWDTGDWNGDFEFTTADLVLALSDGGFNRNSGAIQVPEPRSTPSGIVSLFTLSIFTVSARQKT